MIPISKDSIELKEISGTIFVRFNSIIFLRSLINRKHSFVKIAGKNETEIFHSLKWLQVNLPKPLFCRCHKEYIVNCLYIKSLNYARSKIILHGCDEIPFSRLNRKKLISTYKEFLSIINYA